jgi:hypothetical protein
MPSVASRTPQFLPWLATVLLACLAGPSLAQSAGDPPGRAAFVSQREGSVVFAPAGEEDWADLPQNRPLTEGDRLWTDRGGRAEVQLGTSTVHMDSETHLGISTLEDMSAQFMLQQGTVNARVREVAAGENFEIGTPNIAFRALQPGNYRIEVDPQTQLTRVVVHSGTAAIFGEGGQSIHLGTSQQAVFAGRFLAQVSAPPFAQDTFGRWADQRNVEQDQAVAARYVPRGVVGASELDRYGTWGQDPTYGAVWYPATTVANWAPYRYGHWSWVSPWGWTWVDDAPWGFAPFHYGRWTMIGPRWAWVPGRLGPRPLYAPALVVFLGGSNGQFSMGSGPAVGWYPLAPGEAWYPWYRTTPRYVTHANAYINLNAWPRDATHHAWRQRPQAVTVVREDDFRRGTPVERHWQPAQPGMIDRARVNAVPPRPQRGEQREGINAAPRLHNAPPVAVQPQIAPRAGYAVPPLVREQREAQHEQDRLQRDAERDARRQMRQQYEDRQDSQRNAGRSGGDPNAVFGRPPAPQPRMVPQRHEAPVPVPRQQAVPIVREERRAPQAQPQRHEARGEGRWQHQAGEERRSHGNSERAAPPPREGGDEGRGRGHWNR